MRRESRRRRIALAIDRPLATTFRYTYVAQPAVELDVGGADTAGPYSQVEGSGIQLTQHCGASTARGADELGKQWGRPLCETARQVKFQGLYIGPVVTISATSRHSRCGCRSGEWGLGLQPD